MPEAQLSPTERKLVLALMTLVTEASNPDLKARYGWVVTPAIRRRLDKLGYITFRRADGVPGRPYVHELTDAGWSRGHEELAAEPPEGSQPTERLLYGIVNVVDRFMAASGSTLSDIFTPQSRATATPQDLGVRITAAYEALAKKPGDPVFLRRIRERLPDVLAADFDAALLELGRRPGVHLQPETKQRVLTDADRAAAISIGGDPKHLLVIEGS